MERLGVIGDMGPESTIAYYRLIVAAARNLRPTTPHAPVLINSIDVQKVLRLVGENSLVTLTDYLVAEIEVLARAGAKLGLLGANTPHIVFDDVRQRSPIPLVSIVEATSKAVKHRGLRRVALFGTRFTMQGRFYPDVFAREGIDLVLPDVLDQDFIHDTYVNELLNGTFLRSTRDGLLKIVDGLKNAQRIEAVILAGTELPLILTEPTASGIPLLDTTELHVDAAVRQLWERQ